MVQIIKKPPEVKLIQIDKIHVTNLVSRKRHAWTDIGELMESIKSGKLEKVNISCHY